VQLESHERKVGKVSNFIGFPYPLQASAGSYVNATFDGRWFSAEDFSLAEAADERDLDALESYFGRSDRGAQAGLRFKRVS
jgi:hypothetical protein